MTDDTDMPLALGAEEEGTTLDTALLAVALFQKLADAQLDLLRARAACDRRNEDECLLRMRAAALLLACMPAHPDSRAFRLKTVATVALREEDGNEASHAWLMAERALLLDQRRHQPPGSGD